jgi:hypothetical protein
MYVVCFPDLVASSVANEWEPPDKGQRQSPGPLRGTATSLHDATKSGYNHTVTTRV